MTEQDNRALETILVKIEMGLSLLRDGKEIPAYAKFQGVRDNIYKFINSSREKSENNRD